MILNRITESISWLLDIANIAELIISFVLQGLFLKWIPRITDRFLPREERFLLRKSARAFVKFCFGMHLFMHFWGWRAVIEYLGRDALISFVLQLLKISCFGLCIIRGNFSSYSIIQNVSGMLIHVMWCAMQAAIQNLEFCIASVLFVIVHAFSLWYMWRFYHKQKVNIKGKFIEKVESFIRKIFTTEQPDSNGKSSVHKFLEPNPYVDLKPDIMVLKHQYVQVRTTYKYLSIVQGIIFFLFVLFFRGISLKTYMKVTLLLLLAEILCYYRIKYVFYNGYTEEEYWDKVSRGDNTGNCPGENEETQKDLQESVKQGAGTAWIGAWKRISQEESSQVIIQNKINAYIRDTNYKVRCLGKEWLVSKEYEYLEVQCMDAAVRLLHGESIYFGTKFYRNVGPYIFPFINLELLENKKILVLSGSEDKEEKLRQWMQQGLQKRYGHLGFWNIQSIKDGMNAADIGIMTMSQMADLPNSDFVDYFMRDVSVVILHEPSAFMFSHPIIVSQIVLKMGISAKDMIYIVCDRDIWGMADILEHSFKRRFIYVNMKWQGRSVYSSVVDPDLNIIDNPFGRMDGQGANELVLSDMLVRKLPFTDIHWYMNYLLPTEDIQNGMDICASENGSMLSSALKMYYNCGNDAVRKKDIISIVEDNLYNVCEVLEVYSGQGYGTSFCIAMSPNYLLRNFLVNSAQNQCSNSKRILQCAPRFLSSVRNMAILIGHRLIRGTMEAAELRRIVQYFGHGEDLKSVIEELNNFYEAVPELRDFRIACGNLDGFNKGVWVRSEKGKEKFKNWYDRNIANIFIDDASDTNRNEWKSILPGGHVYQYFLPKYTVVLDGRSYFVEKISSDRGVPKVELSRMSTLNRERKYYRQIRNYVVKDSRIWPQEAVEDNDFKLNVYSGDIQVMTTGYVETADFLCRQSKKIVESPGIPVRTYKQKRYLHIQVCGRNCVENEYVYGSCLKEILFTLFPQHWQLLSVAMDNDAVKGTIDVIKNDSNTGNAGIYVIEDSLMDMGILDAMRIHFEIINTIICEYMGWARKRLLP